MRPCSLCFGDFGDFGDFADINMLSAHCFVLSKQPAYLTAGKSDGLGGQVCRVDVAAHQYIHLLLSFHL